MPPTRAPHTSSISPPKPLLPSINVPSKKRLPQVDYNTTAKRVAAAKENYGMSQELGELIARDVELCHVLDGTSLCTYGEAGVTYPHSTRSNTLPDAYCCTISIGEHLLSSQRHPGAEVQ